MKILILQLARLGDIYQTWPVLHALKRTHPQAEVHFLTRSKFAPAAPGAETVDRHWLVDTRDILLPLIEERPVIDISLEKIDALVANLKGESFDKVINLSFSPFSSYLTKEVSGLTCEVKGYTRTSDGYLSIPDDGSAYFYAQVGIGRPNRLHLTDVFAFIAGVDLAAEDWQSRHTSEAPSLIVRQVGEKPIVIHIGASDLNKTLSWSKWLQVARGLIENQEGQVVLVGSNAEREIAEKICSAPFDHQPLNLVGQTNLDELFEIVARAGLLIGGDSAPIHIASLTNTPVLNISFPMVSLWETGPRSENSRIMPIEGHDKISAEEIVTEALAQLRRQSTLYPVVRSVGPLYPYVELRPHAMAFEWQMLKAIYMQGDFPGAPSELFLLGMKRLGEVTSLAREQLNVMRSNPTNSTSAAILDRVTEIIDKIKDMVPELSPLVRWFQTELLRIGPMSVQELIEATDAQYENLAHVIELYNPEDGGDLGKDDQYDNLSVG